MNLEEKKITIQIVLFHVRPGRGLCLSVILEIEYFVRRNIDTNENVSYRLLPSTTCRLINRTHGLKEASNFPFSFSRH